MKFHFGNYYHWHYILPGIVYMYLFSFSFFYLEILALCESVSECTLLNFPMYNAKLHTVNKVLCIVLYYCIVYTCCVALRRKL